MKRLAIGRPGTGDPIDVNIEPGTTARDVIRQAGLEGFMLAKKPAGDEAPISFATDEEIYTKVMDGEKLLAVTPAKVG
jgi:hypothetical protein